jgi:cytosine/creatinine deaminase
MEGCTVSLDLIVRNVRLAARPDETVTVGVSSGRIAAIAAEPMEGGVVFDADGGLLLPGFVETHIHLDKTCILDRCSICEGTVQEAIRETARAKLAFTEEDIYARARRTLERAIVSGTQHMRAHTEIDPRIGLKGFNAIRQLARDYAWAVDLEICVFPQEGLTNDPGAEELLMEACTAGADLIGGAPYVDTDPHEQIARIFALARRFDLDIDFHLDFDLDTSWTHIDEVCRQTDVHGWGGRVAAGHMTKLSAMPVDRQLVMAKRLADAGVAITAIPSTDLFLMGRSFDHNVPRGVTRADRLLDHGVTVSLATNNVMNAFTPFGDASLIRMSNLYANIAQLGRPADLDKCLAMITTSAARLMNLADYGLEIGRPADFVVVDSTSGANAVAELAEVRAGFKRGVLSFTRPRPALHHPAPNR